jgi:hypothetical protein
MIMRWWDVKLDVHMPSPDAFALAKKGEYTK